MEITLTPKLQQFAEEKVAAGHYPSVNEMLNLLIQNEQDKEERFEDTEWTVAEIKQKIAEGDASIARGACTVVNPGGLKDLFDGIIARGNKRLDAL